MRKGIIILLITFSLLLTGCASDEEKKEKELEKLITYLIDNGWDCTETTCEEIISDEPTSSLVNGVTTMEYSRTTITFDIENVEFEIIAHSEVKSTADVGLEQVVVNVTLTATMNRSLKDDYIYYNSTLTTETLIDEIIQEDRAKTEIISGEYHTKVNDLDCDQDSPSCFQNKLVCNTWSDYLSALFYDAIFDEYHFREYSN